MRKPALSRLYAASFPPMPNNCLSAVYAWTRCPRIHSPALIPVDIPSAVNAFADTSQRALRNIDFLYSVPLALQIGVRGKRKLAVRVACQMVVAVAPDPAPWLPFRGFAVPSLKPRTHRRAIQNLDGNGNGFVLHSPTLQKVRLRCSSPHFLCQPGTGASGRCSWPETNMKRRTLSSVPFRTANMHGANSVNSQSTLVGRNTHAMVRQNWTF